MKVCVIGAGYVGLVTGAVFSELGNEVICVDKVDAKVQMLKDGVMPIYEPGLEELVNRNVSAGRLSFTSDFASAVDQSEIIFLAVGTPPKADGSTDLSYVDSAAKEIALAMRDSKVIVNKSTVPIGTGERVRRIVEANLTEDIPFEVASNPEFLREGSAISDSLKPDRIVIGAPSRRVAMSLLELYAPLERPMIITDVTSAEMIKYASNAFLATKISFANSIANLCDAVGADITEVTKGMGLDNRIGPAFLNAGIGYGGSCFPKDTSSLIHTAATYGVDFGILNAVVDTNARQPVLFVDRIANAMDDLEGKTVCVLGLAFKGNTDDLRDSKAIEVIKLLIERGATVNVFDPIAMEGARELLPDARFCADAYEAAGGADALAVVTEWNEFKTLDFSRISKLLKGKLVFDGRNIYDPDRLEDYGLVTYGVGRSSHMVPGNAQRCADRLEARAASAKLRSQLPSVSSQTA